jgi:hypothetical protein
MVIPSGLSMGAGYFLMIFGFIFRAVFDDRRPHGRWRLRDVMGSQVYSEG